MSTNVRSTSFYFASLLERVIRVIHFVSKDNFGMKLGPFSKGDVENYFSVVLFVMLYNFCIKAIEQFFPQAISRGNI